MQIYSSLENKWPSCYARRDVPGRILRCRCVPRKQEHPACGNCLILIGPEHLETYAEVRDLPVLREIFDEDEGVWVRELVWLSYTVCEKCLDDIDTGRFPYTIRLDLMTPRERKERAEAWLSEHPEVVVTRRYLGGYVRPTSRGRKK
jgi:hypothetical protein